MGRLASMIARNVATLSTCEPYFAPNFAAARTLLLGAKAHNAGLAWASGAVCGPHGCSCGNRGCLHQTAWRVFVGK